MSKTPYHCANRNSNPARRQALLIVAGHQKRKDALKKAKALREEMLADVKSAKLSDLPQTRRPYPDFLGEKLDKLNQLQDFIDHNEHTVQVVESALDNIGKEYHISKAKIEEFGGEAEVRYWSRKSIELSIINNETGCDFMRWPFSETLWKRSRRRFLSEVARNLYLDLEEPLSDL